MFHTHTLSFFGICILPGCREEVIFSPFLSGLALQFTLVCLCRSDAQVLYTHNLPQKPDATEKTTNQTPSVVAKTPSTSGKGPTVASASSPRWKTENCIHQ